MSQMFLCSHATLGRSSSHGAHAVEIVQHCKGFRDVYSPIACRAVIAPLHLLPIPQGKAALPVPSTSLCSANTTEHPTIRQNPSLQSHMASDLLPILTSFTFNITAWITLRCTGFLTVTASPYGDVLHGNDCLSPSNPEDHTQADSNCHLSWHC